MSNSTPIYTIDNIKTEHEWLTIDRFGVLGRTLHGLYLYRFLKEVIFSKWNPCSSTLRWLPAYSITCWRSGTGPQHFTRGGTDSSVEPILEEGNILKVYREAVVGNLLAQVLQYWSGIRGDFSFLKLTSCRELKRYSALYSYIFMVQS